MFDEMRRRYRARARFWDAQEAAAWRLAWLVVETAPGTRAEVLRELAQDLHEISQRVEVAFRQVEPGSADGAKADARLVELLAEAEQARAESRPRLRSNWGRMERAAGAELDRLAEADMADAEVQAEAYRRLWMVARPHLPGVHAGELLATIERGSRVRATGERVGRALSYEAAAA